MAGEEERLGRDLASPEFAAHVEQGFWSFVERDKDTVYVLLHAPDGRKFLARLECDNYWNEPIRCTFVAPQDRQSEPKAWPDGNAYFERWIKFKGTPWFICWPQDRQGIEHHKEWTALKAWQKKPNQLVAYLDFLRQMLHVPSRGYNCRNSNANAS